MRTAAQLDGLHASCLQNRADSQYGTANSEGCIVDRSWFFHSCDDDQPTAQERRIHQACVPTLSKLHVRIQRQSPTPVRGIGNIHLAGRKS